MSSDIVGRSTGRPAEDDGEPPTASSGSLNAVDRGVLRSTSKNCVRANDETTRHPKTRNIHKPVVHGIRAFGLSVLDGWRTDFDSVRTKWSVRLASRWRCFPRKRRLEPGDTFAWGATRFLSKKKRRDASFFDKPGKRWPLKDRSRCTSRLGGASTQKLAPYSVYDNVCFCCMLHAKASPTH